MKQARRQIRFGHYRRTRSVRRRLINGGYSPWRGWDDGFYHGPTNNGYTP